MMKKTFLTAALCATLFAAPALAALPEAPRTGGMPLLEALQARRSQRSFSGEALTPEQMSGLLWAAGGVNSHGTFTYPTAVNVQDMLIYAFTADGVFLYDPRAHDLMRVAHGDRRADTGMQPFVASASVNLVYVQDTAKWAGKRGTPESIANCGFIHAGCIAQNASLYAAAQGWSSVVRGSFDKDKLAAILKLNEKQKVLLTQSIGPAK